MPRRKETNQSLSPFQDLLQRLLKESGESYRSASIAAGLGSGMISSYIHGARPMRDACIALADHFGINPNKMLEAAGYEPLHFFDRSPIAPSELSPEVEDLAKQLQQIEDRKTRQRAVQAIRDLLRIYIPSSEN